MMRIASDVPHLCTSQMSTVLRLHAYAAASTHITQAYAAAFRLFQNTSQFNIIMCSPPVHLPGVNSLGRLPSARQPLILVNVLQGTTTAGLNVVAILDVTQTHLSLSESRTTFKHRGGQPVAKSNCTCVQAKRLLSSYYRTISSCCLQARLPCCCSCGSHLDIHPRRC
jgi:hypothetical protein